MDQDLDSPTQQRPPSVTDVNQTMDKLAEIISKEKSVLNQLLNESDEEEEPSEREPGKPRSLYGDKLEKEARKIERREFDQLYEAELIDNIKAVGKEVLNILEYPGDKENENKENQARLNELAAKRKAELEEKIKVTSNRLHGESSRIREKIATLQYKKYQQELEQMKPKPFISQNSKKLLQNKSYTPIQERSRDILAKREENLAHLREEKFYQQLKEEESINTFQPEIYTRKYPPNRVRTVKQFTNQVYAWQARKNEHIQREKYDKLTQELEGLTFRPEINEKSRKLAKKYDENGGIVHRLERYAEISAQKKKKLLEEAIPSFRPTISSRKLSNQRERRQSPRFSEADGGPLDSSSISIRTRKPTIRTRTYLDLSVNLENPNDVTRSPKTKRNVTPNPQTKTTKVQQVEYKPSMEFITKRVLKF